MHFIVILWSPFTAASGGLLPFTVRSGGCTASSQHQHQHRHRHPAPAPAICLHHMHSQLTAPAPAPGTQQQQPVSQPTHSTSTSTGTQHQHRHQQPVSTACTASSQHQRQRQHRHQQPVSKARTGNSLLFEVKKPIASLSGEKPPDGEKEIALSPCPDVHFAPIRGRKNQVPRHATRRHAMRDLDALYRWTLHRQGLTSRGCFALSLGQRVWTPALSRPGAAEGRSGAAALDLNELVSEVAWVERLRRG